MTNPIDLGIARWVADHRIGPVTEVCRFLEDLGTSPSVFTLVALAAIAVVALRGLWGPGARVAVAWLVTVAVTSPLKELFDRPRPPADLAITTLSESSMPSSHAVITSAAVVAVLLAPGWTSARWHRVAVVVGVLGCLVVAASMIYLGGHWLTDVLVGWVLGVGISGAVMLGLRRVLPARS